MISHADILRSRSNGSQYYSELEVQTLPLALVWHRVVYSILYLLPEPYSRGSVHLPGGDLPKLWDHLGDFPLDRGDF
jgi:hypothetical protein